MPPPQRSTCGGNSSHGDVAINVGRTTSIQAARKHAAPLRMAVAARGTGLPHQLWNYFLRVVQRNSCEVSLAPKTSFLQTGGFIHCELLRLLFLHAHRETTRFFEIFDDGHAPPRTSRFTYRRAASFITLKSKTDLMVAKAAALWTNINIDGRPLPTTKRRRTSSKACAPHLLHACAPHFHIPLLS